MKSAAEFKAEGNKAFAEKNFEQAAELFSKAIELEPNDHLFYSNRSACYTSLKKYEQALQDAEKCISLNPGFAKGYSRKSSALFHLEKLEEAMDAVEEGLKVDPNNEQLKKDKANLEEAFSSSNSMNDIMGMLNNPEIQKLMKENPQMVQQFLQNPQMAQMMMNMMKNSKQPAADKKPKSEDKKEETKPKFEEKKPEEKKEASPFEELKNAGNNFYKEKKFEEAIAKYDECIKLDEKNLLVRNNKAACLIELKKVEEAKQVVDKAVEKYKELEFNEKSPAHLAKLLARRARISFLENNFDESIKFYEDSLLEDRNENVEKDLKETRKVKKQKEEESYIDPEKADEHRKKGNDFFEKGDFGAALKEYEEAVKRNPKDSKIYNNRASCFIKIMNYQQALVEVEKALKLEPKFVKALLRKASIHDYLKEYHKAIEVYNAVLALEPDNAEATKGIQLTNLHISASMQGETDEQRIRRAMADPEIAAIAGDPMVRIALEQMQANPKNIPEYMRDKTLGPKISKLIQAGIVRTG